MAGEVLNRVVSAAETWEPGDHISLRLFGAEPFEVDINFVLTRYSIKGKLVGVGYIKAECIPTRIPAQSWFPIGVIAKGESIRLHTHAPAENNSEQPAGDDEMLSVSLEVKSLGPSSFICCKGLLQALYL